MATNMSESAKNTMLPPSAAIMLLSTCAAVGLALWARNQGNAPVVSIAMGVTMVLLVLAVAAVLRVAWSLMVHEDVRPRGIREERSMRALRQEKSRVLRALKELEFDFELRKISVRDFEVIRDQYRLRAVELNRLLAGASGRHASTLQVLAQRQKRAEQGAEIPGNPV
jgi:hypothetical protein